jgi:hypothetical protein
MQLMTAMEDFCYTCWLDPDRVPAYVKDDDFEDITESLKTLVGDETPYV